MRDSLKKSLEKYLRAEGRLEFVKLGPGGRSSSGGSRMGAASLRRELEQARELQRRVQMICVVLLCLVFALQVGFLLYGLLMQNLQTTVAGGAGILLLPVVWRLRRIWLDSLMAEFIHIAARDLPPEESLRIIYRIYMDVFAREQVRPPEPEPDPGLESAPLPEPVPLKIPILFLTSDPSDAARLRLGKEAHEIEEKLTQAKLRDRFDLHQRLSVRPADLSRALLDIRPELVHFSGHGMADGSICLEDDRGEIHPVTPSTLADLFREFRHVRCVLLNACYAERQAAALAEHIDYAIGPRGRIDDGAAIPFAVGFYQALGAGCTIEEAYRLGCIQLRMEGWPESAEPILVCRPAG